MKKILFLACNRKKDAYGITSGLYNSATFVVNYLKEQGVDAKLISVLDSNQVDKEVTLFNPDIVIVEALWIPPAKFYELLAIKRHQKRRWIVRIHSKAPFLANEGMATFWIDQYCQVGNIEIAPNTRELTRQLSYAFPYGKFIFLPNIYFFEKADLHKKKKHPEVVDVGCFGAVRPMKNQYQQALAAIEFAEKSNLTLRFHINSTRMEQGGENVEKNLRALFLHSVHELMEHKWYHHKNFLRALSKMDIGMQVSFSESFNIVTADFVAAKVPIVASDDIAWMPWFLRVSPTSHEGMVRKLKFIYRWKKFSTFFQTLYLKAYNFKAKLVWLSAID